MDIPEVTEEDLSIAREQFWNNVQELDLCCNSDCSNIDIDDSVLTKILRPILEEQTCRVFFTLK